MITTWLTLILIANIASVLIYLFIPSIILSSLPSAQSWIIYLFALLSIINIVIVIFLFKWKMWAFHAFILVSIIGTIINILAGLGVAVSLLGLLSPFILYLILLRKWELFE